MRTYLRIGQRLIVEDLRIGQRLIVEDLGIGRRLIIIFFRRAASS